MSSFRGRFDLFTCCWGNNIISNSFMMFRLFSESCVSWILNWHGAHLIWKTLDHFSPLSIVIWSSVLSVGRVSHKKMQINLASLPGLRIPVWKCFLETAVYPATQHFHSCTRGRQILTLPHRYFLDYITDEGHPRIMCATKGWPEKCKRY